MSKTSTHLDENYCGSIDAYAQIDHGMNTLSIERGITKKIILTHRQAIELADFIKKNMDELPENDEFENIHDHKELSRKLGYTTEKCTNPPKESSDARHIYYQIVSLNPDEFNNDVETLIEVFDRKEDAEYVLKALNYVNKDFNVYKIKETTLGIIT